MRVAGIACASILGLGVAPDVLGQTPSFNLVGLAPSGVFSRVQGLSADGRVAAGYTNGLGTPGFTWTAAGGRRDFGLEPGAPGSQHSAGMAISGDGSTVVGEAGFALDGTLQAFRYRGPGTFENLGTIALYPNSYGEGVSGDGSVVVGRVQDPQGFFAQAFRWTPGGGMQGLGWTREAVFSEATGVSRDGSTIVGRSMDSRGFIDAFRWTAAEGMQILPQVPGTGNPQSYAYAVNFDGSIIVGQSGAVGTAAMWRNGQVVDLGTAVGWGRSRARAVNDDGSVVVGEVYSGLTIEAGVWTSTTGMILLSDYLASSGVTIPAGWTLRNCYAISGDGNTVAGFARSTTGDAQGFVATIPTPYSFVALVGFAPAAMRRRR
jgi:uncharacterized membrane protein